VTSRLKDTQELVESRVVDPAAMTASEPDLFDLGSVHGGNRLEAAWDGIEYSVVMTQDSVAWGQKQGLRITRVAADGRTVLTRHIRTDEECGGFAVAASPRGGATVAWTSGCYDGVKAISARSFSSMTEETPQADVAITSAGQYTPAVAGRLAVWVEQTRGALMIRGTLLPHRKTFPVAALPPRAVPSVPAVVRTGSTFVVAWWQYGKRDVAGTLVLQRVNGDGTLAQRAEPMRACEEAPAEPPAFPFTVQTPRLIAIGKRYVAASFRRRQRCLHHHAVLRHELRHLRRTGARRRTAGLRLLHGIGRNGSRRWLLRRTDIRRLPASRPAIGRRSANFIRELHVR
jgi:hypothetical protein